MAALPAFRDEYQLVPFRGADPVPVSARIWVRRSGPIGIERTGAAASVPGYLLAGNKARAELDREGRIALRLPGGQEARAEVALAPGRYIARVEATGGAATELTVGAAGGPATGPGPVSFEVSGQAGRAAEDGRREVRLAVRAATTVHVRRVVIEPAR
jgi:hypothetical protein